MRPHVSFSEYGLFKNECQYRWKLDYLEGRRAANFGVHLDFGTAIHAAIERYKTRKNPKPLEYCVKLFRRYFNLLWKYRKDKYSENDQKQDKNFFLDAGENILRHMHNCGELWDTDVLYNEHELFIDIDRSDDLKVKFKGFIDMVVKSKDKRGNTILYVFDFKSCSWGWGVEKKQDKHLHAQLLLYKHFLCKKFNLDPQYVRTGFVLLKKKPKDPKNPVEVLYISAGPVSVQRALDDFNSVLTEMAEREKTGNFEKNRQSCVNAFGQRCPYYQTDLCPGVNKNVK